VVRRREGGVEEEEMIEREIVTAVDRAIEKVIRDRGAGDVKAPEYSLEAPPENIQADYATNAAMILSSRLGESSIKIAGDLVEELSGDRELFESVKFVKPGFINFFINKVLFFKKMKMMI